MVLETKEYSAEVKITVPFHDVDPAGVVWHGRYIKYFELARSALLEGLNYSHREMEQSGYLWPVVDLRVKYVRPLRYGQTVIVSALIKEWERRLKIKYIIKDQESQEKLTEGHTIQVACDIQTMQMQYESPSVLKKILGRS